MMALAVFLILSFPAFLTAQQPDYFPLATGNTWIYQCAGACPGSSLTLTITDSQDLGGTSYFLLKGWGGNQYWLREDDSGSVLVYNPDTQQEQPWYMFGAAEGQTYQESLPACCGQAMISSTAATYQGPIGEFDSALEIRYPGVFQVGIYRELFLDGIGLVHREEARGGPAIATYELIYARLGSTVISRPEVSFSISLDRAVYPLSRDAAPVMTARLALNNTQPDQLTLTFPTTQTYDLELRNENGDVVYTWSSGQAFGQVVRSVSFGPGETNWVITVPLAFPAGRYVAQGWLTSYGPAKAYSASVGFELR